jgi:hypothetical protein
MHHQTSPPAATFAPPGDADTGGGSQGGGDSSSHGAAPPRDVAATAVADLREGASKRKSGEKLKEQAATGKGEWAPAHLRVKYGGLEHYSDEACGDKRRSSSLEESVLVPRKRRLHVEGACMSCKNSHIACDDRQPCRNCVRRRCRCVRHQPKSAGANSKVAEPAEESEEVQEISDDASSAPTATGLQEAGMKSTLTDTLMVL